MSTEPSPRADQIQANVAAALSRLRGESAPGTAAAPAPATPPADMPDRILTTEEPLFSVGVEEPGGYDRSRMALETSPDGTRTSGTPEAGFAQSGAPGEETLQTHPDTPLSRLTGIRPTDQPDLLAGIGVAPPPLADLSELDEEAFQRWRRLRNRLVLAGVAVILLAGFWVLSGGGEDSGEVPVIAADATPERVKPEDEGGLAVPNQDVAILNNAGGESETQAETVLPAPEQPVAPPSAAAETSASAPVPEVADAGAAAIPSVSAPPVDAIPSVPAPEVPAADTSADTSAETQPATDTAAEPVVASATEPAAEPTATAQPTEEAEILPKVSAAIQPVPGGTVRIQLASVKSEAAAREEWARLQRAHPAILGGLELTVERFEKSADEIYYRVQAGPLGDKASAKQICADLKQKNQACIVAN